MMTMMMGRRSNSICAATRSGLLIMTLVAIGTNVSVLEGKVSWNFISTGEAFQVLRRSSSHGAFVARLPRRCDEKFWSFCPLPSDASQRSPARRDPKRNEEISDRFRLFLSYTSTYSLLNQLLLLAQLLLLVCLLFALLLLWSSLFLHLHNVVVVISLLQRFSYFD